MAPNENREWNSRAYGVCMKCLQNKRILGFPNSTEMCEVCGSIVVSATKTGADVWVTADNLYFGVTAVPAPGVAALLGVAALVSRRRR